ncbi:hypothetical protein A3770_10p57560 [Chloropicon primus]|uniref:Uncharacterized protein n=1 Tax=Chloropicon primus TaxID=1764295 RepID=A0A5B8MR92_9CHLO|nr:hypothetical protein A3770_10p57560 [Chloropicon primus]|eukprot:QDZ23238.1 hypothetical protein A3770_10p57560 [Chloropicon primus]
MIPRWWHSSSSTATSSSRLVEVLVFIFVFLFAFLVVVGPEDCEATAAHRGRGFLSQIVRGEGSDVPGGGLSREAPEPTTLEEATALALEAEGEYASLLPLYFFKDNMLDEEMLMRVGGIEGLYQLANQAAEATMRVLSEEVTTTTEEDLGYDG